MYRLVVKEGISGRVQSSLFLDMRPPPFFSFGTCTLMNVLCSLVLVTKMPIAPTMKVLIAVRVNGDSVGMV